MVSGQWALLTEMEARIHHASLKGRILSLAPKLYKARTEAIKRNMDKIKGEGGGGGGRGVRLGWGGGMGRKGTQM